MGGGGCGAAHVGDDQVEHRLHAEGSVPAVGAAAEGERLHADGAAGGDVARVPDAARGDDAQQEGLGWVVLESPRDPSI